MALNSNSSIHFFFENVSPSLKNKKKLKDFIGLLFKKEGKKLSSLNYIFCTDEALLKVNRQYLNHDFYTDIISFDLSDSPDTITAEVYISVDRVKENARKFNKTAIEEIHRVIFHGALHFCGYNDKTAGEVKRMRMKEDDLLSNYFRR